ncbi:adhesion G-protein coupled receptor G4 isoform X1 [Hemibagrus wyckioides]|uniref:adhesion G-protein coupled receptor G4 isoform X1 n=1 Tax=Hemibagrus wyckioides TaxID=337641 RepID=UPI00266C4553|nr:adhesion G-protein coupled receptor G4 isoform X1 [Hemibagrus wyckioides]XP_058267039.1 adhesion G-protein coupled receptor G4 isoform X1 [Hemibagrus wyckioides]
MLGVGLCFVVLLLHVSCARDAAVSEILWGKTVVLEHTSCQFWRLNPNESLPSLSEFTVCVNVQRSINSKVWSAFTYLHPDRSRVELGFGGRALQLQVRVFGRSWVTEDTLTVGQWHAVCITWSCSASRLALVIDGKATELRTDAREPSRDVGACALAGGGSLTLGAAHYYVGDNMEVESGTNLQGRVTMFRVWGRARSVHEIATNTCTDGDVIKWHGRVWLDHDCTPVVDHTVKCVWSLYELKVLLLILSHNKPITTYEARNITYHWLRTVLPVNISLPTVVVFKAKSFAWAYTGNKTDTVSQRNNPNANWFEVMAHLNVIPCEDVGKIQEQVVNILKKGYTSPTYYHLITHEDDVHVYPTDSNEIPLSTPETSVTVTDTPTNTPVTKSPPTEVTDSFFKVSLNVTITGSEQDPALTLQSWLHETLSLEGMSVLNFRLTSPPSGCRSLEECSSPSSAGFSLISAQSCDFQMLVTSCLNVDETQNQIRQLLEQAYSSSSVNLQAEHIHIMRIHPGECPQHPQQTRQGLYIWKRTAAQCRHTQPCEGDKTHTAIRQCLLCAVTNRAVWIASDLRDCPTVVNTLSDLEQITVTKDTAKDVLKIIVDIMKESKGLNKRDLWLVLNTLEIVLNVSTMTFELAQVIINITSDILNSKSDLHPFTNYILNITERVGNKMSDLNNSSVSVVAAALALSVVNIDTKNFYNLTFGVTSMTSEPHPAVYINQDPAEGTVVFISLPPSLHASFPPSYYSNPQVQFQFYGVPALFQNCEKGKVLNTYVVAASVINAVQPISDLKVPVVVMLHHLNTNTLHRDVQCVYWNFSMNGGFGGWSPRGCWKHNTTHNYTTCMCDHLTHFGVLLDISRTPVDEKNEKILTLITYTGCGMSSFFLGVTVLTYTLLEKLRCDYPSQILLNLSIALLGLNLVFLVNSWISSFGLAALCVAVATTQHYFLLASFTWMFLEAVNMYFALVKVFNAYVPSYILKFCFIGWGVPLLICCLVLVVKPDSYGLLLLENSEMFCWVSDSVVFYVCVVGVVGLILLVNGSVFLLVLLQVRRACVSEHRGVIKELRGVTSLTLLLGLTWSSAFLTWGDARVPLLYIFSILNSLQGFFIFLFQCLMKENVRKQWRVHLCFGRFKLQEYSEWSHTPPIINKPKHTPMLTFSTAASVRSNKSNSTQSSSASSHCTEHHFSVKSPDLGVVYQQSFILPRAQRVHTPLPEGAGYNTRSLNWIPKEVPDYDVYFN